MNRVKLLVDKRYKEKGFDEYVMAAFKNNINESKLLDCILEMYAEENKLGLYNMMKERLIFIEATDKDYVITDKIITNKENSVKAINIGIKRIYLPIIGYVELDNCL